MKMGGERRERKRRNEGGKRRNEERKRRERTRRHKDRQGLKELNEKEREG